MKSIRKELTVLTALLVLMQFGITPSWAAISMICADCEGGGTSTPTIPLLSQISTRTEGYGAGYVFDMQLRGTTLYTGNVYYDPIFDVSDPRHPFKLYEVKHILQASGHYGIEATGKRYYSGGIYTDVWGYPTFQPLGEFTAGIVKDLDVVDNKAYIVTGGFGVWDVADPTHPVLLQTAAGNSNTGVVVDGSYVYLGSDGYVPPGQSFRRPLGLRIFNASDLSTPIGQHFEETGSSLQPSPRYEDDFVKAGNRIFQAHRGFGIRVLNVTNPAAPVREGLITSPTIPLGGIIAFEVVGNRMFVATRLDKTLRVLDLTNLAAPTLLATADLSSIFNPVYDPPNSVNSVEVEIDPVRRLVFVGGEVAMNTYDVSAYLPCATP